MLNIDKIIFTQIYIYIYLQITKKKKKGKIGRGVKGFVIVRDNWLY